MQNGIQHVVVAGDMADSPLLLEHELIAIVLLLLKYDKHLNVYYILGNHDFLSTKKTSMDVLRVFAENKIFKKVHLFYQSSVQEIEGITCQFVPFPKFIIEKTLKPSLVFTHIETEGALGDNGRPLRHGHDTELVRQRGDFIMSGHLHQHQFIKDKRILYPGNLYQKNFGEKLPKGFLDVTVNYKKGIIDAAWEFINSKPNFQLKNVVIKSQEDWERLTTDSHIRYKITLEEGIIVPKDMLTRYPNIVNFNGASKTKEIEAHERVVRAMPQFGPKSGLKQFLRNQEFSKREIVKAIGYVDDALHELKL
jgi:DNA repair exonuclease SbcCD nuclease subunit